MRRQSDVSHHKPAKVYSISNVSLRFMLIASVYVRVWPAAFFFSQKNMCAVACRLLHGLLNGDERSDFPGKFLRFRLRIKFSITRNVYVRDSDLSEGLIRDEN